MPLFSNAIYSLCAACLLIASLQADELADFALELKRKFPEVQTIATGELAAKIESNSTFVLLDVRSKKEFQVSHLPGAQRAESLKEALQVLTQEKANSATEIVLYCSVGYRSSLLAKELQTAGYPGVRNLEGSIFAWANEGRPLTNDSGTAAGVHPYDRRWGRYLRKSLWHWESP